MNVVGVPSVRQRDGGQLFTARQLIELTEYPEPRRVSAFYCHRARGAEARVRSRARPLRAAALSRHGTC